MGYEKKAQIKKNDNGTFLWLGEKNLLMYDQEFESHLKLATTEFYAQRAANWLTTFSCYQYILKVSDHLKKEEDNAEYFLQPESKKKILDLTLQKCVEERAEELTKMESGCEYMFNE